MPKIKSNKTPESLVNLLFITLICSLTLNAITTLFPGIFNPLAYNLMLIVHGCTFVLKILYVYILCQSIYYLLKALEIFIKKS